MTTHRRVDGTGLMTIKQNSVPLNCSTTVIERMILSVKGQHLMKQMFRFYQLREHSVDGTRGIVVMQGRGRKLMPGLLCVGKINW